uniref:Poly(A) polymerase RNA-binding domain-containing protein n=1 Tax=Panagrolaimus sp. JU765 TaxID=591449 RepID=A0AC34RNV9_9BILA
MAQITPPICLGRPSEADLDLTKKFEQSIFSPDIDILFVCCTTATQEDQASCGSLVEAKLRNLVVLLERNPAISICHVNPKQYKLHDHKDRHFSKNSNQPITTLYFIGIEPSKKSFLFMDEPRCDENGLPINKNDRSSAPGNKIVFCSKHTIHLDNVQVKQLERPSYRPAIHSFIPLHALFKGQKPSYGQSTPFECGCSEGSYYCIAFNGFMKKMREEHCDSPEFSVMTKSYLSSLAVCRTAIDADELDRADAEKTQDILYVPATKAPLNLGSVMQWFERLHTGPHPSVYAYDQTPFNLYDDGISFQAELSTNQTQHSQHQQKFHQHQQNEQVLTAN